MVATAATTASHVVPLSTETQSALAAATMAMAAPETVGEVSRNRRMPFAPPCTCCPSPSPFPPPPLPPPLRPIPTYCQEWPCQGSRPCHAQPHLNPPHACRQGGRCHAQGGGLHALGRHAGGTERPATTCIMYFWFTQREVHQVMRPILHAGYQPVTAWGTGDGVGVYRTMGEQCRNTTQL